jgi:hypothetical protein
MDPVCMALACYECMLNNSALDATREAAAGMCDVVPDNQDLASLVVASEDQRTAAWLDRIKACMLACLEGRLRTIVGCGGGGYGDNFTGDASSGIGGGGGCGGQYYAGILYFVQEMLAKAA